MDDLPYIEELDDTELGFAREALSLLSMSDDVAEGFAPQTWHLLGRHAYYTLGEASAAVDALLNDANTEMDREALGAVADVLRQALTLTAQAVGESP